MTATLSKSMGAVRITSLYPTVNGSLFGLPPSSIHKMTDLGGNRPFAQLLPGLETGHLVTVGQSPAYDFSVSDEQKAVFLVSVSDCSECDSYAGD